MSSSLGGGERRLRPQDLVEQWSPLPRWWPMVRAPPRVCSALSVTPGLLQSFLPVSPLLSSPLLQALVGWCSQQEERLGTLAGCVWRLSIQLRLEQGP